MCNAHRVDERRDKKLYSAQSVNCETHNNLVCVATQSKNIHDEKCFGFFTPLYIVYFTIEFNAFARPHKSVFFALYHSIL